MHLWVFGAELTAYFTSFEYRSHGDAMHLHKSLPLTATLSGDDGIGVSARRRKIPFALKDEKFIG